MIHSKMPSNMMQRRLILLFTSVPVTRKWKSRRVTKRCCLSWLTNSALAFKLKCGGGEVAGGPQPMSTAVHMEPNKLWSWTSRDLTPYLTYGKSEYFLCIQYIYGRKWSTADQGALFWEWGRVREGKEHRKIRLIEGNTKCRHLKNFTCKGTLWQVFICLMNRTPYPPPFLTHCILIHTGKGGGWTREKG
jgi:hypothetical protein